MKKTFKSTCGTSFFSDTILTSINELKKINLYPTYEQNNGENKVNFRFDCETESGEPFTIYDWKLYRPIGLDEEILFHIGASNQKASEQAKNELVEALQSTMKKNFYIMYNIGKAKYVINFYNGVKTHSDGSPFYDIKIFQNKKTLESFKKQLIQEGYSER